MTETQSPAARPPWLPPPDVIVGTVEFTPAVGARDISRPARTYTIIHTTEVDGYEEPPSRDLGPVPQAQTGDKFQGTARKAAKLSIAPGQPQPYSDVKALIASLPPDQTMAHHTPPITDTATSGRVKEEMRNVHVAAFLYAASKEADNDFHLMIGTDPKKSPPTIMNMELSGLPPTNSAAYAALKAARDAFKAFFGSHLPGPTYDFYNPPIPVAIEGSVFFDITHATGQKPGPATLRQYAPTILEVHPLSKVVFEPQP
ncbi:MAG: hypothetical protein U0641_18200 [Anaerolineae bacterium]